MSNEVTRPVVIFFREDGFYPIEFLIPSECNVSLERQAADHAELNPGTIRVETIDGTVLWRMQ